MSNVATQQSAKRSGAVTKSDTTELTFKRLYVGGTGNVAIQHGRDGPVTTYLAVPGGAYLYVEGVRVMAATTATNIVWEDW